MSEDAAFQLRFEVRWSDLDANRHLRNTMFSEYATHTRFSMLAHHGFTQPRFEALRFGPVMLHEEIRYRREVLFGDTVTVSVRFAGLSADGSHWKVVQEVRRADGKEAAVLTIQGGWIGLDSRRLVAPPPELRDLLLALPRAGDFQELPSMLRRG